MGKLPFVQTMPLWRDGGRMLGLLIALLPVLDVPVGPALLDVIPARFVGQAVCSTRVDPLSGEHFAASEFGVLAVLTDGLVVRATDDALRIGGCGTPAPAQVRKATLQLRLGDLTDPPATPLRDLVSQRCVTRRTLRPYRSLALLGDALAGFALELSPSRNFVNATLIDASQRPAVTYALGRVGMRTLEWCDRTDVAEGHCPNPTHGDIRQVVVLDDQIVLTLGLGLADVCGQDDLVFKAFPLPPAVRRTLKTRVE